MADGGSGFVADMFEVATHGDMRESPLSLDAPASTVRIFLDAMFISGNPSIHTDPKEFKVVLALCDRFQSPAVEDKLFDSLTVSPIVKRFPFLFFVLAAKKDRPQLAVSAVAASDNGSRRRFLDKWTASEVDDVGGRYFIALLKACVRNRGIFGRADKPAVGENFERLIGITE